ncbi:Cof-type HAD-IIB family hydrolase [Streptococcus parauberis]|uniref:Cof-like hydrolase n=3 Tax=Streptococcus parauberis TaxID=1348 RepID=F1YXH2_9STRE|nr:Cof-type HAD-IIB family hydrolase [Streptococcus parauberis]AEF24811.1 haloacid dehalogenase-like hydrolase [Streptococcus parauberis KCTC 11537]AUT05577.1 5-amino-6-(5-phospho-D-ribitylamino)uracil phosphatase YbjI [Streptococcus parauberis]EGE54799.1 Cof-like hydrolase [Streptococcus parauberis NCFD 2020]EMF49384.1 Hydrolase (HAD superfamily) [Streptococcus parauberis KRS-02109]EMG26402.1 Hydrolase (HAD superfamily) [Streptococcus parauberis KRS-02083]
MIKLVATDMDGTFLKEDGTYDKDRLANLLPKLAEKGIIFTVASGRSVLAIDELFKEHLDKIAVIAENGSVVQYQGQVIFSDFLTKEQYIEISKKILINPHYTGAGLTFSGQKAAYILKGAGQAYIDKIYHYYENVKIISDFDEMDDDAIYKITTTFSGDTVLDGSDWLDRELPYITAVTTGFESIDVILTEVNKGFGMEHLCKALGIEANQVMAFGDNLNDFQMLEYVGTAIATENARPEIKAISQEVIGHCNDASVLSYLEGLVRDV